MAVKHVDPREILGQIAPQDIPGEEPPPVSNYRDADVQGMACAFCTKFNLIGYSAGGQDSGDGETEQAGLPKGYCDQWEAYVDGWKVCDRFSSGAPTYDANGAEQWDIGFASDDRVLNVIHFNEGEVQKQPNGLFRKAILRTGHWPFTPGPGGLSKQPLTITRDGQSDPSKGIISMAEVVENFKEKALPYVPLTLSDDDKEHPRTKAKLTQWAKGFIRDIFIQDEADGTAKLFADIEVTEPDVRQKIENGTYADCSSGIPFGVMRKKDGKVFGTVLEHVTLTNNPFIDELGSWALAAADDEEPVEVVNYQQPDGEVTPPAEGDEVVKPDEGTEETEVDPPAEEKPSGPPSHNELRDTVQSTLYTQLRLGSDYRVIDIRDDKAVVENTLAGMSWLVSFETTEDGKAVVAEVPNWEVQERTAEPVALSDPSRQLTEMEKARRLRELRLSQSNDNQEGGSIMSGFDMTALDGVELSDEARNGIQGLLAENDALKQRDRKANADKRVKELEGLGFDQRPGFLKLYRQVMLSDDGGPAAVLLSDDGQPQEQVTALAILDRAIDAIKGSEGKVEFSDQHTSSGNDVPPPADAEGENKPSVEDRVAATKAELGIK